MIIDSIEEIIKYFYIIVNCFKFPSSVGMGPFRPLKERSLFKNSKFKNLIYHMMIIYSMKNKYYSPGSCIKFPSSVGIVPFS